MSTLFTSQLAPPEAQLGSIELGALPFQADSEALSANESATLTATASDAVTVTEIAVLVVSATDVFTSFEFETVTTAGGRSVGLPGSDGARSTVTGGVGSFLGLSGGSATGVQCGGSGFASMALTAGDSSRKSLPGAGSGTIGLAGSVGTQSHLGRDSTRTQLTGVVGTTLSIAALPATTPTLTARTDTRLALSGSG